MSRPRNISWTKHFTDDGDEYFYDVETCLSQWDRPDDYRSDDEAQLAVIAAANVENAEIVDHDAIALEDNGYNYDGTTTQEYVPESTEEYETNTDAYYEDSAGVQAVDTAYANDSYYANTGYNEQQPESAAYEPQHATAETLEGEYDNAAYYANHQAEGATYQQEYEQQQQEYEQPGDAVYDSTYIHPQHEEAPPDVAASVLYDSSAYSYAPQEGVAEASAPYYAEQPPVAAYGQYEQEMEAEEVGVGTEDTYRDPYISTSLYKSSKSIDNYQPAAQELPTVNPHVTVTTSATETADDDVDEMETHADILTFEFDEEGDMLDELTRLKIFDPPSPDESNRILNGKWSKVSCKKLEVCHTMTCVFCKCCGLTSEY
jgi:hypothetical protein